MRFCLVSRKFGLFWTVDRSRLVTYNARPSQYFIVCPERIFRKEPHLSSMKLGFKVGEKLVYPNHGVTVVEQIGESPIMERARQLLPPQAACEITRG